MNISLLDDYKFSFFKSLTFSMNSKQMARFQQTTFIGLEQQSQSDPITVITIQY